MVPFSAAPSSQTSNLEDADLNAAIFDSATFANCDVSQAKLPRSMAELDRSVRQILEGHYAWILSLGSEGMRANLSGFDLTRQSFQRCELSAGEFSQSLLIETDMTRANLSMAQFVSVNGMDARFAASTIRGANLSNAVMTRADFRDVDASAMKISGARDFEWPTNFTGTVLDDANLQGINMCGAQGHRAVSSQGQSSRRQSAPCRPDRCRSDRSRLDGCGPCRGRPDRRHPLARTLNSTDRPN